MRDGRPPVTCVRVLGGVEAVASDGSTVAVPSASQRRLLGVLALHAPRRLRSERLADLLGVTPGALRTTVARLRVVIGPEALLTGSTGYSVACDVDASLFCRAAAEMNGSARSLPQLERTLALWNGPPLEEFDDEEWATGEAARLTEIHAGAVDDYAEALISARRSVEAVALLESHVTRHPYRDRPRGLLIRALALAGRQSDALRAFQAYRSLLVEELGVEPSSDVVRIEQRIATGWNGVQPGVEATAAGVPAPPPPAAVDVPLPAALTHRVGLVGRQAECTVLGAELELAASGGLRVVVLGGEPGIGKTTLLAEFAWSAVASGAATVLYGRCEESGAPLEPFGALLGACVDRAPVGLLAEHVSRCGGELVRLCPRLADRVPAVPPPTGSDDVTERFLAFDAATDLLKRIATVRPLVLIIDDLQWAQPTALLLLGRLARDLADSPVLVVVARRRPGGPASDELRETLAELGRDEGRFVELGGLDEAELAELVVAVTRAAPDAGLRDLVTKLREDTAGNPLYATQLVRHWVESGRFAQRDPAAAYAPAPPPGDDVPPSLLEVVWSRVHALGQGALAVLSAASVLGTEFPEDVLIEMADADESAVVEALNAAEAAGLTVYLRPVRRRARFVHALVAGALYSEIGPATRARLHERAAAALLRCEGSRTPDTVVQLARHSSLAGLTADALRWSVRAGDDALSHLAPTEAARHYRTACDAAEALRRPVSEWADLLVRLGDAQHRAGDPAALDNLGRGAEMARRSRNGPALVRAALAGDRGFMRLDSRAPEYLSTVEAAVAAADPDDVVSRTRVLALLAQSLTYTAETDRRVALAHQARELADATGDPALIAHVAPAVLAALWTPGSGALRSAIAARAVESAEASGDPRLQFSAHHAAYNVAVESADATTAAASLMRLRSTATAVGEPRLRWIAGLCETFDTMMAGRLDDAEALASANLELGTRIAAPDAFTFFAAQFFVIGTFAGKHQALLPLVEQAMRENPDSLPFRLAYAIACATVGRTGEARDILRAGAASGFEHVPADNVWMTSIVGYAVLAVELADVEVAAALLPLVEPFAREVAFNGITSQGPVAAYTGKLASLLGRNEEAEEHLRAALATATAFGWAYHRATTLFALAQARHRAAGALDGQAQRWLSEASRLCRDGGFDSWTGRIDQLAGTARR